jgi:molybdopterin molybdotransferase
MKSMPELLDYHDALAALLAAHAPIARTESVPLAQLASRVLAQDVAVRHDVPAFDHSAMDGYALGSLPGTDGARWRVSGRIAAGDDAGAVALQPGEAARIFTGAPIPAGTQAVVMQEHVQTGPDGHITLAAAHKPPAAGANIRRQGEELRLLAGQGLAEADCFARLRVTVFSSGDELADPGQPLRAGQIYDSNRPMLRAWLGTQGFEVRDGGRLPDDLAATRQALRETAASSDAIVCTGGVSVGEEDHLKAALHAEGELTHWQLRIKPGKPFAWGRVGVCRAFLLPGNPVASLVGFQQLALPALRRLAGLTPEAARPPSLPALAGFERSRTDARREFLRVKLVSEAGALRAELLGRQGAAMLSSAAEANALAEITPEQAIAPGQVLVVYPLLG